VTTRLPIFVVMAVKERHRLTANLLRQLGDADQVFIYDNGSRVAFPGATVRADSTIHEMWNEGLDAASTAADGGPHNVAVLNNDLDVGPGFLTKLAAGLRHDDRSWLAYPDWEDLGIDDGAAVPVSRRDGRHLSGWAFMLRGEAALRFDEQFEWWYGDTDLQFQIEEAGHQLVCVGGIRCDHLESGWSTSASSLLQARAEADRIRFEQKWANRS
jgi:GT2 family glycosyltransferase